ncbi:AbrB/MazE/SpoVT family DNA-binding domain-containing protein [Candidatus Woesearchaeota archaeon]|nr:AbrB/MazE/SpoVT family DNA-binding domain-containing protein [Candidatus Woesearchaeota archaeon]MBI2661568.1 AbrB/MazE/SpoVT family DNA-binding domain-containing protein [Candidatus Woesearchaeota archaeon]
MIITVSKGQQITIPSEYRKNLGLRVGSKVEMIKKGAAIIIKPIDGDLSKLFEEARSIKPKHRLTAKQMDVLIENEILR